MLYEEPARKQDLFDRQYLEELRSHAEEYLSQEMGITRTSNFHCFNHDQHKDGDKHPSAGYIKSSYRVHCFTCHKVWDIFDMIGIKEGIDSFAEQVKFADEWVHGKRSIQQPTRENPAPSPTLQANIQWDDPEAAYKYLEGRGISRVTAEAFGIKVAKSWNFREEGNKPAIVFPYTGPDGTTKYLGRQMAKDCKNRYTFMKGVGAGGLMNPNSMENNVFFVVEGVMDCLTFAEMGVPCVGLANIQNYKYVVEFAKNNMEQHNFVIGVALDADNTGGDTAARFMKKLDEIGVKYMDVSKEIYGGSKDANEAFNSNKDVFFDNVMAAQIELRDYLHEEEQNALEEYEQGVAANTLEGLKTKISNFGPFSSTGFFELDEILDGGLYPGLYFIGALSSLGKTTFAMQLVDQVAANGRDVLFFSLEMAKEELISKSLSRLTYLDSMENEGDKSLALTVHGIMDGTRYKRYSQKQKDTIERAYQKYAETSGKHIYFFEGVGKFRAGIAWEKGEEIPAENDRNTIAWNVYNHIKLTGRKPVVVIDYTQILAPYDPRSTDKQNTDKAVLELKRISRVEGIPIIAVSSFNRENYNEPLNMSAFKESGAIEYSSDVLIGLQYPFMDYMEGEKDNQRRIRIYNNKKQYESMSKGGLPLQVELKVLKNRNGGRASVNFQYYTWFNFYKEMEKEPITPIQKFENLGTIIDNKSIILTPIKE